MASGPEARHRATVLAFHREALARGDAAPLARLCAPDYHPQLPAHRGLQPLAPGFYALAARVTANGPVQHEVIRVVADGDLVCAHVRYDGPVVVAGADFYRLDADSRIVEHWNIRQPIRKHADAVAMHFDTLRAPQPPAHYDPAWLRARVRDMMTQMWMPAADHLVSSFYDEGYVQHNPDMPGGSARILEIVRTNIRSYIERTGTPFPIEIHRIAAEGDLVCIHISIFMAGINRNEGDRSTNVDIFRVGADGRMTEHWDVLQMESETLPDQRTLF